MLLSDDPIMVSSEQPNVGGDSQGKQVPLRKADRLDPGEI